MEDCLRGFLSKPGASEGALQLLTESLGAPLPAAYLDFLRHSNGGEGFIGKAYLRFYSADGILEVNQAYAVAEYLPGFLLIASNTIGDAICFRPPFMEGRVVQVPFIPLRLDYAERVESSFSDFIARLAASRVGARSLSTSDINPAVIGKEIFQRHPIVLGGSPTDPNNRDLVSVEEHPELVRYWNNVFRQHSPR